MLAKKVYDMMHKKDAKAEDKTALLFAQKTNVPSLQDLARDVVAENFDRYPHLNGVPEKIKQEVFLMK